MWMEDVENVDSLVEENVSGSRRLERHSRAGQDPSCVSTPKIIMMRKLFKQSSILQNFFN